MSRHSCCEQGTFDGPINTSDAEEKPMDVCNLPQALAHSCNTRCPWLVLSPAYPAAAAREGPKGPRTCLVRPPGCTAHLQHTQAPPAHRRQGICACMQQNAVTLPAAEAGLTMTAAAEPSVAHISCRCWVLSAAVLACSWLHAWTAGCADTELGRCGLIRSSTQDNDCQPTACAATLCCSLAPWRQLSEDAVTATALLCSRKPCRLLLGDAVSDAANPLHTPCCRYTAAGCTAWWCPLLQPAPLPSAAC